MKSTVVNGKPWKVAGGFNLYIDITTACNASCPFCIAPIIGRKNGTGFFDGAQVALNMAESVKGTVQIVGGEPLISARLPRLLNEIRKYRFPRVVINTNGSRITDEIVTQMKDARVQHVNISRHHYDESVNQAIMLLRPPLPNMALAGAIERIKNDGIRVRLQCNLMRGYVDSLATMLDYIDWCHDMGVTEISFSQIFPLSLFDYQAPPVPGYTESVQIDLHDLVVDIDTCGKFMPTPEQFRMDGSVWGSNWGSCAKRRFWRGPRGILVSIKTLSGYSADGLPAQTHYSKADDPELQDGIMAFAVLHTDGRVTASWDRHDRILFDPFIFNHEIQTGTGHSLYFSPQALISNDTPAPARMT